MQSNESPTAELLAVDVHYHGDSATAAGVLFASWEDSAPARVLRNRTSTPSDYRPGEFYLRELPCILTLLDKFNLTPKIIIVDGYAYLDGLSKPGLGKQLYDALNGLTPVIGLAKNPFANTSEDFAVLRGDSRRPLYVTSAGIPMEDAKRAVASMHGKHRIPTLLKRVDTASRGR